MNFVILLIKFLLLSNHVFNHVQVLVLIFLVVSESFAGSLDYIGKLLSVFSLINSLLLLENHVSFIRDLNLSLFEMIDFLANSQSLLFLIIFLAFQSFLLLHLYFLLDIVYLKVIVFDCLLVFFSCVLQVEVEFFLMNFFLFFLTDLWLRSK